jgi:hypothetical protein
MARQYESLSVEELTSFFGTVTRQRVQQILKKYQDDGNTEMVSKIGKAKLALKIEKHRAKTGATPEECDRASKIWAGMQIRCGKVKAYLDCTVAWESSDAFRAWAIKQPGFNIEGFELDKDILVKGNRVYSPETCVFVPLEINSLLSGCYKAKRRGAYPIGVSFNKGSGTFVAQMSNRQVAGLDKYLGSFPTSEEAFACYKVAKEAKLRKLAEKWKDRIDPRAYEALMARTVEWDD